MSVEIKHIFYLSADDGLEVNQSGIRTRETAFETTPDTTMVLTGVVLGRLGHDREIKRTDPGNTFPFTVDTLLGSTILTPGVPKPIVVCILTQQPNNTTANSNF